MQSAETRILSRRIASKIGGFPHPAAWTILLTLPTRLMFPCSGNFGAQG